MKENNQDMKAVPGLKNIFFGEVYETSFIIAFEVFYRVTGPIGYFECIDDAQNFSVQRRWCNSLMREVILQKIGDQYLLIRSMALVELYPTGSFPFKTEDEMKKERRDNLRKLADDLNKNKN